MIAYRCGEMITCSPVPLGSPFVHSRTHTAILGLMDKHFAEKNIIRSFISFLPYNAFFLKTFFVSYFLHPTIPSFLHCSFLICLLASFFASFAFSLWLLSSFLSPFHSSFLLPLLPPFPTGCLPSLLLPAFIQSVFYLSSFFLVWMCE